MPGCSERANPPPPSTTAQPPAERPAYVEGEVLVRFRDGVQAMEQDASSVVKGARVAYRFRQLTGLQHVKLPEGLGVEQALALYRANPRVAYAEPNYLYTLDALPADSRFRELWGLNNTGQTLGTVDADLNAPEAWALTEGSEADVVAVIDSGVDFKHPDLAANMWVNPGEVPGNGVDDDGNGYIDDVHGIDATDAARTKPPMDEYGHGTHVAGTIAARAGNGLGVVGVSPRTKILACKTGGADGSISGDAVIRCLDYLVDLKTRARHPVNVIATNNSWGGGLPSQALQDGITRHLRAGILFVCSAGNDGKNLDLDNYTSFPAEYVFPNILTVGASDPSDHRASFSNYGRQKVDVFAPGVSILSTVPGGGYAVYEGTSMAAPHVTGLVALLHAQAPERDWRALRNLVLSGGQEVPALKNLSVSGRRIRAVDTGGVGSLSCAGQTLVKRLEPSSEVLRARMEYWTKYEEQLTFAALNIRCGEAAGPVTIQLSVAPWSLTLLDDGQGPDLAAGDGIATAAWEPSGDGPVTVTFPGEDSFIVHPRYSWDLAISGGGAFWMPEYNDVANFEVKFLGYGAPAPWTVQWDADYDGRFDVDGSSTVLATGSPTDEVLSRTWFAPANPEATTVAVRIIDANGNPSPIRQLAPEYTLQHASPVQLSADVVVPQVRHPVAFNVTFIAPRRSPPWFVDWDFDYDGKDFHATARDTITTPEIEGITQSLARTTRAHAFTDSGAHRVAMRITDFKGHTSAVNTWGAVVVCGTPIILGVDVEGSQKTEPVTASLRVRAEPGCEPILRYHWDFDGDGQFDAVTSEPSVQHVYTDNPTGQSSQRALVRVEADTGSFDKAFEVPIENASPVVEPIPEQQVTSLEEMTYQAQVSDPGGAGDALGITLEDAPAWVRVNETGLLSWTAPREWAKGETRLTFDLVVSDDEGVRVYIPVTLVPAYRRSSPPTDNPSGEQPDEGCSTTGGTFPAAAVLLGFVLRTGRRRVRGAQ
ncbi:S8 family serine peptidase [Pyxidicoccus parkwayensis]|uniref:S8 family serine peptidase n=1 Tax=Pyxidicoccus parkwayensis TaxID=2813578 RepID=A0ABX7NRG1_9BACT|nr:S8 family peptidase [Pyxidicoccus parkwaysis]QSQ21464.1 S8 family serine peptidase [Pyxidicoccus parkwaysis]